MTDLMFDHTKSNLFDALSIKKTDLKKFFVDVEEHMTSRKKHSEALEFIWSSEQSFEMKIASTFALGGLTGVDINGGSSSISISVPPPGVLKDLFKQLKKDGLI